MTYIPPASAVQGNLTGSATNTNSFTNTYSITGSQSAVTPLQLNGSGASTIDMSGYSGLTIYPTSFGTGVSIFNLRASNDGTNFQTVLVYPITSPSNGVSTSIVVNAIYIASTGFRYYQIVIVQAQSGGTSTANINQTTGQIYAPGTMISANTNAIGGLAANSSGGTTTSSQITLTNTVVQLKASTANWYGGEFANLNTTVAYIQLFFAPSASVTLGTTPPSRVIALQPNQTLSVVKAVPTASSGGFSVAATTTATGSTALVTPLVTAWDFA